MVNLTEETTTDAPAKVFAASTQPNSATVAAASVLAPSVATAITEPTGTSPESASMPPELSALFATAIILGVYKWKSEALDADGCLAVAILRDNEDGPVDEKGRLPLTSATLTKSLSARFLAACGETIFKHKTRMAITIRTENFTEDLAAGIGRTGTGKGYFIGQGIDLNP